MQMLPLWELRVIADCEGRSTKITARFTNKQAAQEFAESDQGRDMYGHIGEILATTLELYDTAEEAGAASVKATRQEALGKLSDSEKAALGLTEP